MNNPFKIGNLVLLIAPLDGSNKSGIPNGAIGEIMDASKYHMEMCVDEIAVHFPSHLSDTTTGWWKVPQSWLKPLDGDGILSDEDLEDNPYKVDKPVEETV